MKVVKVTDKINSVIAKNLVTIKLDVLTHRYPPLPLGKYFIYLIIINWEGWSV